MDTITQIKKHTLSPLNVVMKAAPQIRDPFWKAKKK